MARQLSLDANPSLPELRQEAAGCKACDLYKTGTHVVFGEGDASAEAMFVGEQPGDQEDKAGRPFVGPAGKLFDQALADAGIDRKKVYVTNAVKHFKWVRAASGGSTRSRTGRRSRPAGRGSTPSSAAVEPRMLVCLGATAAQALLGRQFRVTRERGKPVESDLADHVLATIHPSAILRGDPASREQEYAAFVADLKVAAELL